MPRRLLATMFTTTTYGTWPPGDLRGYVDRGRILPGDPRILNSARARMTGEPVYLTRRQQDAASDALLSGCREFRYTLLATSIESWHVHLLVDHGYSSAPDTIARLKTRMRQAVNAIGGPGRVWTEGYDARYCFADSTVARRRAYIARHRGARPVTPLRSDLAPLR